MAYANRGMTYGLMKQYDKAIEDCEKALALLPGDSYVQGVLDTARENKGKIEAYTRQIEANPDDVEAIFSRGYKYFERKMYDEAVADFTKAIEVTPDDPDAYNNRGLCYYYKGDYDKAIEDYTHALELASGDLRLYNNRG